MQSRLFGAVIAPFTAFFRLEAASGIVLLASAVAALLWANLHPDSYRAVFDLTVSLSSSGLESSFTLRELIDDGLMAIFFLVVGMEIKRELVDGALNTTAKAALPAAAALGGMVVPAAICAAFVGRGPHAAGWGIPVATDIAFAAGVLTLLGRRVSHALVVFVTALAIFDDIGGILVIALFYGQPVHWLWLLAAAGLVVVLVALNRARIGNGLVYAAVGAGLWYALHHGGVHASLSGVVLGLAVPSRARRPSREVLHEPAEHVGGLDRKPPDADLDAAELLAIEEKLEALEAPLRRFVHLLHPYVAFAIMPLFALASSGLELEGLGGRGAVSDVSLGVGLGLLIGKPVGIFSVAAVAVKLKLAPMPEGGSWAKLLGVAVVGGIGFTVALFIATLAYPDAIVLEQAKLGVLAGSLGAGLCGAVLLRATRPL